MINLKNMKDVGDAIKSGQIGVIDAIKIGDVVVSALTGLSGEMSVDITDKAVQAGFTVTDGVIRNPRENEMTIVLADPQITLENGLSAALTGEWSGFTESWQDKKNTLIQHFENYDIVEYTTHEDSYPRAIIKSITPIFDSENNWDCYVAKVVMHEWDERSTTTATGVDNAITASSIDAGAL